MLVFKNSLTGKYAPLVISKKTVPLRKRWVRFSLTPLLFVIRLSDRPVRTIITPMSSLYGRIGCVPAMISCLISGLPWGGGRVSGED